MRKIIGIMALALMFSMALVGCAGDNETSRGSIVNEAVDYTMEPMDETVGAIENGVELGSKIATEVK